MIGCSSTVEGTSRRQEPGARTQLQQLLPTAEEVSAAVGNPLDATGPAVSGSIDVLPDGIRDASQATPLECLGAVTPLMRVVYEDGGADGGTGGGADSGVLGAAWQDFARFGEAMTVSSAEAGVIRLESEAAAARMFARFVSQWRACDGVTVTLETGQGGLELTPTGVRVDGPVLAVTVVGGGDGGADGGGGYPTEHAVGVAGDYLVDVDVAITDPDPDKRVPASRAADLVRVMLDKIDAAR